ncbi:hypothetical protein BDN72DRAFT_956150 [Pluteus cervinus]|uniref:Uncharacterized protein n=1 Tax=Pluteus cervinus TaxID=181527 RepID=A0ACD3B842_9AGAR|nr:hypothetical protein BDN72DRAFT_956150 [Pluteus cervinus]
MFSDDDDSLSIDLPWLPTSDLESGSPTGKDTDLDDRKHKRRKTLGNICWEDPGFLRSYSSSSEGSSTMTSPSNSPVPVPRRRPLPLPIPRSQLQSSKSQAPARTLLQPSLPLKLNPHPIHWYEDGNLLVELNGVHFKLLWTLMANTASFFQVRHDSWKNDEEKQSVMTGREPVVLDGESVRVEDFAELLNLIHLSNPSQLEDQPTLRCTLSIVSASNSLSASHYFKWAKERLMRLWTIGDDFNNLLTIASHSPKDARTTLSLAQACQIHGVIKPALYSLMRHPTFGFEDQDRENYDSWTIDLDLVRCRNHLVEHWTSSIDRLRLPSCARGLPPAAPRLPSATSCASNDTSKSDSIYFNLLWKNGFYPKFLNDPLVGLQSLRNQLLPTNHRRSPTAVDTLRMKRKRGGHSSEQEQSTMDDSDDVKPVISPWAESDGGGYCQDCRMNMWVTCSEAMEECWEKLGEWAGLQGV